MGLSVVSDSVSAGDAFSRAICIKCGYGWVRGIPAVRYLQRRCPRCGGKPRAFAQGVLSLHGMLDDTSSIR